MGYPPHTMRETIAEPEARAESVDGAARMPRWLWLVAAAALVARLAVWLQYRTGPIAAHPMLDAYVYWEWAGRLASGSWLPKEVFHQAPLYPYLLGGARALVPGLTPAGAALPQLVLNWGTALLLYPIALRRFGGTT